MILVGSKSGLTDDEVTISKYAGSQSNTAYNGEEFASRAWIFKEIPTQNRILRS